MRLALDKGASTRNGTDLVRYITEIPSTLGLDDVYWFSLRGNMIGIYSGGVIALDDNGNYVAVEDTTGGYPYLAQATGKNDIAHCTFRDSAIILVKTVTTATQNSADYTISGTVSQYRDLSNTATINQYYKVDLPDGAQPSGYYQRYDSGGGILDWKLVAAPNQPNASITATTMPHKLTQQSDGSWQFATIDWTDRRSGNDQTNPRQPWFGDTLKAICNFSGRIFFISKNIISSTSSRDHQLIYNYNADDPADVSNPISQDISKIEVGTPLYAEQIGNGILLLCQNGQLFFSSGREQLTNVNGSDFLVSTYQTSQSIPANTGSSIVFLDRFNTLHEFNFDASALVPVDSGDLNSHVLRVLQGVTPSRIYRFDLTTVIPTSDDETRLHEKGIDAGNLVQTGWCKFSFNVQDGLTNKIHFLDQWNGYIRILQKGNNGFVLSRYVHKEEVFPSGFTFAPHLDNRKYVTGTYSSHRNITRFTYPNGLGTTICVTPGAQSQDFFPAAWTTDYVEYEGDLSGQTCCIGTLFYNFFEMAEFYPAGGSTAKPTVSTIAVFYKDTRAFDLLVRRRGNSGIVTQREYQWRAAKLGSQLMAGTSNLTGFKVFNILLDGRNAYLRFENQNSTGMTLVEFEFDIRFSDNPAR